MCNFISRRRSNLFSQTMAELEQQIRELREEVSLSKHSVHLQG